MYRVKNKDIDLNVTHDHRMWVSIDGNNFYMKKVQEIVGINIYYKTLNGITFIKKEDLTINDSNGIPVFCLQVPHELFCVRRKDGKPVWTGNSRSSGPYSQLVRQPSVGRARDGGLRIGKHFAGKSQSKRLASPRCGGQHSQTAGTTCGRNFGEVKV